MRLLVVRHAIAEDRAEFATRHKDDAARPLTPDGRRKMERAAVGLRELVPQIDLLAASPLKRALETAEILAAAYNDVRVERIAELAPGAGVERVIGWLAGQHARGTIAAVGHEPGGPPERPLAGEQRLAQPGQPRHLGGAVADELASHLLGHRLVAE